MARIIVLGGGRQGRIIANDLAGDHDVTVADVAAVNLPGVRGMQRDLSRPLELVGTLHEYDVVVGALPARLGFPAAQAAVKAKRHYVDLRITSRMRRSCTGRRRRRAWPSCRIAVSHRACPTSSPAAH
jgi:saccharopine dehydrogenase-like NADP-dependent oxidoreductase